MALFSLSDNSVRTKIGFPKFVMVEYDLYEKSANDIVML